MGEVIPFPSPEEPKKPSEEKMRKVLQEEALPEEDARRYEKLWEDIEIFKPPKAAD